MRQKRLQGSHFANDVQSNEINELVFERQGRPLPVAGVHLRRDPARHQLMYENKHPHGNMSVLVGATDFGLGASSEPPEALPHPTLPPGDVHTTQHPYPMSEPLPDIGRG